MNSIQAPRLRVRLGGRPRDAQLLAAQATRAAARRLPGRAPLPHGEIFLEAFVGCGRLTSAFCERRLRAAAPIELDRRAFDETAVGSKRGRCGCCTLARRARGGLSRVRLALPRRPLIAWDSCTPAARSSSSASATSVTSPGRWRTLQVRSFCTGGLSPFRFVVDAPSRSPCPCAPTRSSAPCPAWLR